MARQALKRVLFASEARQFVSKLESPALYQLNLLMKLNCVFHKNFNLKNIYVKSKIADNFPKIFAIVSDLK